MRLAIMAFLVSLSSPAVAAEFFILPGTKTLLVLGETRTSDVDEFSRYVTDDKIDSIILNGPGGNLEAGYAIADIVLEQELRTTVPANTDCASACSLIFSAGKFRKMEEGSRLGFHLPFVVLSEAEVSNYCKALTDNAQPTSFETTLSNSFAILQDNTPECLMLTYQMGLRDIRRLSRFLNRDNISADVLDLIIDTQSESMTWVEASQASRFGLVTSD